MILVTGATGKVGGQVVRQLVDSGGEVRALVRDPERAALPEQVEVVRGDLADPGSLDHALTGIDSVFLVWPTLFADDAAPAVVRRLATRAGHIVYLSAMGADESADSVLGSHGLLERLIVESGVDYTFLRAGGFAGNDLGWAESIRADGVVREQYEAWARSVIHEADIAAVGVRTLTEAGHRGAYYELTGPEVLTAPERVAIIAEVLGRPVRFEKLPTEQARARLLGWLPPGEVDAMMAGMDEITARPESVIPTVTALTGAPGRTYRDWVRDHAPEFA
ncbi:NAD(P)H-binding protein [Nocardia sp. NPDC023852]|uniref:NAD(P)H-binding protein n=1 Tax=Nocardia sp. NPDC023852 TaxID=3154697 RepID=UPI0033EFC948